MQTFSICRVLHKSKPGYCCNWRSSSQTESTGLTGKKISDKFLESQRCAAGSVAYGAGKCSRLDERENLNVECGVITNGYYCTALPCCLNIVLHSPIELYR